MCWVFCFVLEGKREGYEDDLCLSLLFFEVGVRTYSSALPVQAARSASGGDRGAFARAAGLGQEDQGRGGPGQSPLRPRHRLRLRGTRVPSRGASSNALANRPPRSQPRRQVRRRRLRLRLAHTPQRRGPARYPAGRRTQRVPPRLPPRACAHAPSPARVPRRRRSPSAPSCSAPLPGTRPSRPTPSGPAPPPASLQGLGTAHLIPRTLPEGPRPGRPDLGALSLAPQSSPLDPTGRPPSPPPVAGSLLPHVSWSPSAAAGAGGRKSKEIQWPPPSRVSRGLVRNFRGAGTGSGQPLPGATRKPPSWAAPRGARAVGVPFPSGRRPPSRTLRPPRAPPLPATAQRVDPTCFVCALCPDPPAPRWTHLQTFLMLLRFLDTCSSRPSPPRYPPPLQLNG